MTLLRTPRAPRALKTILWMLCTGQLLAGSAALADTELKQEEAIVLGGDAAQALHAVRFGNGLLYAAGSETGEGALILRYAVPASNPPLASLIWADKPAAAIESSTTLSDLAIGADGLYAVGVGMAKLGKKKDRQWSGLLAKFPLDGASPLWTARSDVYPSEKNEAFRAVAPIVENGATVIYAAGHAASSADNSTAILAKYDAQGTLLWSKTLGDSAAMKKSAGTEIVVVDGFVYVAGFTDHGSEKNAKFTTLPVFAALWKVDFAGNILWTKSASTALRSLDDQDAFAHGMKVGAVASDGFLYGVASTEGAGPGDVRFLKYDTDGNLLWETGWTALMSASHLKADSAWALGVATGKDRLYLSGFVQYTDQLYPGKDENLFMLEVDKEYGTVLAVHFHGERGLLENAFASTADESTVYAVGVKIPPSARDKKNPSGNADALLVRYSKIPVTSIGIDIRAIDPDKIEVAILSAGDFNAATRVDMRSLTFGRAGSEASWAGCSVQDADQNGSADLLCRFLPRWTPWATEIPIFQPGDPQGVLRGQLVSGGRLEGRDSILPANVPAPDPPQSVEQPPLISVPEPQPVLTSETPVVSEPPPAEAMPSPEPPPVPQPAPSPEPISIVLEPVVPAVPVLQPVIEPIPATVPAIPTPVEPAKLPSLPPIPVFPSAPEITAPKIPAPISPAPITGVATEVSLRRPMFSGESLYGKSPNPVPVDDSAQTKPSRSTGLAIAYGQLAKASAKIGRKKKAADFYREALRLDPELPDLHRDFGLLLMGMGEFDKALEHLREALRLRPNDSKTIKALEGLTAVSGQTTSA